MDIIDFERNYDQIIETHTSPIAITRNGKLLGYYLPVWHVKKERAGLCDIGSPSEPNVQP